MTRSSLTDLKFLIFKALLLSALFHLIFFNLFTFVFPLAPGAHKPDILFLGSILQGQDMFSSREEKAPGDFMSDPKTEIDVATVEKKPLFMENDKQKTQWTGTGASKKIPKSFFDASFFDAPVESQTLKDLGISPHPEPYIPLKM